MITLKQTALRFAETIKKQINDIEAIFTEEIQQKHLKQQSVSY